MIATVETNEQRDQFARLIGDFGTAWEDGKSDRLAELFHPEGVLVPDPFDGPIVGQEAIRGYWRDIPNEQAEIAFRYGEIFIVGSWFSTEFRCTFRRRRTGIQVDVRGALFCETTDGKISEMRMYWHRTLGGRPG